MYKVSGVAATAHLSISTYLPVEEIDDYNKKLTDQNPYPRDEPEVDDLVRSILSLSNSQILLLGKIKVQLILSAYGLMSPVSYRLGHLPVLSSSGTIETSPTA